MSALVATTGVNTNHQQTSGDLVVQEAAERSAKEIEGMMIVAKRYPRDEGMAFQSLMKACERFSFADECEYEYKRGDTVILGPSAPLAREAARMWGNIGHGYKIINDTPTARAIRCYAHDYQTNTRVEADAEFAKLIFRKKDGWIKPDERELRELTNRHAAIAVRNCIFSVVPKDLISDAQEKSRETVTKGIKEDPQKHLKTVLMAFGAIGVTAADLKEYLGCEVNAASPSQIAGLRSVYTSIRDGNSSWSEYVSKPAPTVPGGQKAAPKSAEELEQKLAGEQPQPEKTRRARKPKQTPEPGTSAAPAAPAQATEPAVKPGSDLASQFSHTSRPEKGYTDSATEGQMVALKALVASSPERKKVVDDKLRLWGLDDVAEVNYGTANELIATLESIKPAETAT